MCDFGLILPPKKHESFFSNRLRLRVSEASILQRSGLYLDGASSIDRVLACELNRRTGKIKL